MSTFSLSLGLICRKINSFQFQAMNRSSVAAIIQMTCTSNKEDNFNKAKRFIEKAKYEMKSAVVFLPEAFDFIGENTNQTKELAEAIDGDLIARYCNIAKNLNIEISLGGFHEMGAKLRNSHIFINADGKVVAKYSKCHLFDVELPEKGVRLKESDYVEKGMELCHPVDSAIGKIGLGICYDLRFPEMSTILRKLGSQILTYPSAFTVPTGAAHWESLLRARAIENQCYVIAAAQTGKHNPKRSSYGHSMVVDPWGAIIAQCSEGEGVASAVIDLEFLEKVRRDMPVMEHRRSDLYCLESGKSIRVFEKCEEDGCYYFGKNKIPFSHVVLHSAHCYVCVNRKPVLPYHLLVIPKRLSVLKMTDLTVEETADLFLLVKKVEALAEMARQALSTTISIQDGAEAGQTVNHLHVHILARKSHDFERSDDVYTELSKHDKEPEDAEHRSAEEMAKEAKFLREIARRLID